MIWVRRISAVILVFILVSFFTFALFATQVNDSFANPGFYKDQMRKADVYNFIYDEALPAALDEIDEDDDPDNPIEIPPIKDDVIAAVRKILPPEWLQEQFEMVVDLAIPYFVNNEDEFSFTLVLRDRVEAAAEVLIEDIVEGDAFDSVYDDGMSYLAGELYANLDELPYSLTLSEERIESSLKLAVSKEWMSSVAVDMIDEITPYLTRSSEHFSVTVQLRDRVDAAADVIVDVFSGQETYDYLLDEMITPTIEVSLGLFVDLPFGITLSRDEISSAIQDVLPLSWIQERLEEVVYDTATYVKGESDSIEVSIDLADRKAIALDVLTELADTKLESLFLSLQACSLEEFLQVITTLPVNTLPGCRPAGMSYQTAKGYLNIDIAGTIDQIILNEIPDQWIYTDDDLRHSLGEDNEDFLDDVREWVSDGWAFTDVDITDELDSDDEESLEDVREWIAGGYTVDEADLREEIEEEDLESFDDARRWVDIGRNFVWILWLLPLALLIPVGFLGGRNWRSRLMWSLASLFIISLVICIAVSVTYSTAVDPAVDDAFDLSEYEGVELVMAEKGNEIAVNIAGCFASGIRGKTIFMMIGSGAVLLGVVYWDIRSRRRGMIIEPETLPEEPPADT